MLKGLRQSGVKQQKRTRIVPAVREAGTHAGSGKAPVELAFDCPIVYFKFDSNLALV